MGCSWSVGVEGGPSKWKRKRTKQTTEIICNRRPSIRSNTWSTKGKTYLGTNTFEDKFTFRHSGLSPEEYNSDKAAARLQLDHFYNSLKLYGLE